MARIFVVPANQTWYIVVIRNANFILFKVHKRGPFSAGRPNANACLPKVGQGLRILVVINTDEELHVINSAAELWNQAKV